MCQESGEIQIISIQPRHDLGMTAGIIAKQQIACLFNGLRLKLHVIHVAQVDKLHADSDYIMVIFIFYRLILLSLSYFSAFGKQTTYHLE